MGHVAPIAMIAAQAGQKVVEGVAAKGAADAKSDLLKEQGIIQRQQIDYDMGQAMGAQKAGASASGLTAQSFSNQFAQSAINRADALAQSQYATNIQRAQVEGEGKSALMSGILSGVTTAASGIVGQMQYEKGLKAQMGMTEGSKGMGGQTARERALTRKKSVAAKKYFKKFGAPLDKNNENYFSIERQKKLSGGF